MNILQLMRQARFEIDAIRTGNATSGMWSDEEVRWGANVAMDRTARLLRLSGSELLTKRLRSTETGVDLISEIYSPAASLQIRPDINEYNLPPDFVRVAAIRPLVSPTTGFEAVRFEPSALNDPDWTDLSTWPLTELSSTANRETTFRYYVRGQRTLCVRPTPKDTFDIELTYHYRPAKMIYYSTGTVQRTSGAVGVTGSGTAWITSGLVVPAELLVGVTSVNGVTMDAYYPTIDRFDTDTTLTLKRASTVTDGVGQAYTIALVPALPEEHHTWLAQMTASILLRKVDVDLSMKMQADLAQQLLEQITPEITLRQLQSSLIGQVFGLWR